MAAEHEQAAWSSSIISPSVSIEFGDSGGGKVVA